MNNIDTMTPKTTKLNTYFQKMLRNASSFEFEYDQEGKYLIIHYDDIIFKLLSYQLCVHNEVRSLKLLKLSSKATITIEPYSDTHFLTEKIATDEFVLLNVLKYFSEKS